MHRTSFIHSRRYCSAFLSHLPLIHSILIFFTTLQSTFYVRNERWMEITINSYLHYHSAQHKLILHASCLLLHERSKSFSFSPPANENKFSESRLSASCSVLNFLCAQAAEEEKWVIWTFQIPPIAQIFISLLIQH